MAWIIGIDEAGYGPNLGPFVMTSVACRVPDDLVGADLWDVLAAAVRRPEAGDDDRVVVADSKLLYVPGNGLPRLERNVLAALSPCRPGETLPLADYLTRFCPAASEELGAEPWYTGQSCLPVAVEPATWAEAAARLDDACRERGVTRARVQSVVVCPTRFNGLLDRHGSKGAVLAEALGRLIDANRRQANGEEALYFFVDKHGGRNTYAAMLQHTLDDGLVVAHEEGLARSTYSVKGLPREVRLTFEPRAESAHFCVALASMASKYVRELLMREFNRFWQSHVPGLKATAGYPGDSARFFEAIRPAMARLGVSGDRVWRRK
jgi:ribonuclease HII